MTDAVAEIKWNPELLDALHKLMGENLAVKIGVLSNGQLHPGDKIGAAGLAAVHEFGSPSRKIPERSFLRKTSFERSAAYMSFIDLNKESIFKSITEGRLTSEVMPKIGAWWVASVLECFRSRGFGGWRPLKPATIRRKGSNAPLIDTGALMRSITFEVADK
jgi:phage gpG-like protein